MDHLKTVAAGIIIIGVLLGLALTIAWYNITSTPAAELRDMSVQTFEMINSHRVYIGIEPLEWDNELEQLAIEHSTEMAEIRVLEHSSYPYRENIAEGFNNPSKLYDAWARSPGHYWNMMDPTASYGAIGISSNGTKYATLLLR